MALIEGATSDLKTLAGVADTVSIRIELIRVRDRRTIVGRVEDSVSIGVGPSAPVSMRNLIGSVRPSSKGMRSELSTRFNWFGESTTWTSA
jgi:hypothetical protein